MAVRLGVRSFTVERKVFGRTVRTLTIERMLYRDGGGLFVRIDGERIRVVETPDGKLSTAPGQR